MPDDEGLKKGPVDRPVHGNGVSSAAIQGHAHNHFERQSVFTISAEKDFRDWENWLAGPISESTVWLKSMTTVVKSSVSAFCREREITEKLLDLRVLEAARVGEVSVNLVVSRAFLNSTDMHKPGFDFSTEFRKFFERAIEVSNVAIHGESTDWGEALSVAQRLGDSPRGVLDCAIAISKESVRLPGQLQVRHSPAPQVSKQDQLETGVTANGSNQEEARTIEVRKHHQPISTLPFDISGTEKVAITGYDFQTLTLYCTSAESHIGKRYEVRIRFGEIDSLRPWADGRRFVDIEFVGRASRADMSILETTDLAFSRLVSAPEPNG